MPTVIDIKYGTSEGTSVIELHDNIPIKNVSRHRCYIVLADTLSQNEDDILATTGLPILGVTILSGAICSSIHPREVGSVTHPVTNVRTTLWEVDADFTTTIRKPTDTNPEVNWDTDEEKEVQEYDLITGARLMTTADEPFFIERPLFLTVLNVRRRGAYPYDPATIQYWNGKVNSMPFYGYPPGTCMMKMKITEDTQDGVRSIWEEYNIKAKVVWNFDGTMQSNTWQGAQLNQGYKYREKIGGRPVINRDAHGQPMKVNLDANGLKLKNDTGKFLKVFTTPPTSLNPAKGVYDNAGGTGSITPVASDVGSTIVIDAASGAGWNAGSYLVIGVAVIAGAQLCWILDGNPGTAGTGGGIWEIQRCPIYLRYNRAYPADFNALTLGPY